MFSSKEIIEITEEYGAHNYHPLDVVISKAEGVWVWDVEGKKYMDMLSAYSALNQGHCHPKIVGALKEQAEKLSLTSRAFHNDKLGFFLKKLTELCGMEMALPMNTGAEAVETALKMVRKWGYKIKGIPEYKGEIITCANNFHGRTITIISFSTEPQYKDGFGPFTPGFKTIPFGDIEAFRNAITENTIGILLEPIQGEGGIIVPPEGYLSEIRKITKEKGILMILDEIQTGLGRTGKMFAYEYEDAKPDVLILGKALGGGLYPVSAVVSSKEIMSVFKPGDHGSTFGGNPLASAVAIASLDVIVEENLPQRAFELGNYFTNELAKIKSKYIKEIRGKGLLIGIELTEPARKFCELLKNEGILAKETHEMVIRFAPPLIITKEEIDWALPKIKKILETE